MRDSMNLTDKEQQFLESFWQFLDFALEDYIVSHLDVWILAFMNVECAKFKDDVLAHNFQKEMGGILQSLKRRGLYKKDLLYHPIYDQLIDVKNYIPAFHGMLHE